MFLQAGHVAEWSYLFTSVSTPIPQRGQVKFLRSVPASLRMYATSSAGVKPWALNHSAIGLGLRVALGILVSFRVRLVKLPASLVISGLCH